MRPRILHNGRQNNNKWIDFIEFLYMFALDLFRHEFFYLLISNEIIPMVPIMADPPQKMLYSKCFSGVK